MRKVGALGGPCVDTLRRGEHASMAVRVPTLYRLANALGVHVKSFFLSDEVDEIDAFVYGLTKAEFAHLRTLLTGEGQ